MIVAFACYMMNQNKDVIYWQKGVIAFRRSKRYNVEKVAEFLGVSIQRNVFLGSGKEPSQKRFSLTNQSNSVREITVERKYAMTEKAQGGHVKFWQIYYQQHGCCRTTSMRHKFETMTDLAEETPLYGYIKPNATDISKANMIAQKEMFWMGWIS